MASRLKGSYSLVSSSGRQYRTANFRSTCAARNPFLLQSAIHNAAVERALHIEDDVVLLQQCRDIQTVEFFVSHSSNSGIELLRDVRGQVRGIGNCLSLEYLYQSSPNSGESFQLTVGR